MSRCSICLHAGRERSPVWFPFPLLFLSSLCLLVMRGAACFQATVIWFTFVTPDPHDLSLFFIPSGCRSHLVLFSSCMLRPQPPSYCVCLFVCFFFFQIIYLVNFILPYLFLYFILFCIYFLYFLLFYNCFFSFPVNVLSCAIVTCLLYLVLVE